MHKVYCESKMFIMKQKKRYFTSGNTENNINNVQQIIQTAGLFSAVDCKVSIY